MPKQVDHDARRTAIAEALWRVALVRGLDRVTLREVAAEAGISLGQLQHYFGGRQELMIFAMEFMSRKNVERVTERLILMGEGGRAARLRAIVMEMLPIDEDSRAGSSINIDFLLEAARNDVLRENVRQRTGALRELLEGQIALAVQAGEIASDRDPATEAGLLICLADGLRTHFLLGMYTAEEVLALMEAHLARLLVSADAPRRP
ncbi:TetR/AcrR family transcriptional regulator [Nocardia australiensis]|uniref:TetR/AcrR family transcriptional regulator n=1 Tax=Nocardia australiensis TaxID=2887191 RepID=UPI001D153F96|nr:TetR family transcriptional regulator C-terminal domain-containing protein [Nocardia australiensis]